MLFLPHFYKSISAQTKLLHFDKNFVPKCCVWTMRAIFQNRAALYFFPKKFFWKLSSSVWQPGQCGYGHIKMRTKKNKFFCGEEKTYKNGQQPKKNRYCKSALTTPTNKIRTHNHLLKYFCLNLQIKGAFTLEAKRRKATKTWRHGQLTEGFDRSQTSRTVA